MILQCIQTIEQGNYDMRITSRTIYSTYHIKKTKKHNPHDFKEISSKLILFHLGIYNFTVSHKIVIFTINRDQSLFIYFRRCIIVLKYYNALQKYNSNHHQHQSKFLITKEEGGERERIKKKQKKKHDPTIL